MITKVLSANISSIEEAVAILQQWEIVSFPTETIYGLFGDWLNENAVRKIFLAKHRPADNPLILHVADRGDIEKYALIENNIQHMIINKLMPGPLTIVLPKRNVVPDITTGWLDTVCIRIPDYTLARQIIRKSGTALAWPSANVSGKPSPTSSAMVLHDMNTTIPLIIDWGRTLYGIESTVVKVEQWTDGYIVKILRPWFITKEDIQDVVWDNISVVYADYGINESPGTRYRHYSPHWHITLVSEDFISQIQVHQHKKIALLATKEFLDRYQKNIDELYAQYGLITMPLWSVANLLECAQSLYQLYATCDTLGIEQIYIEPFPEYWVWYALMNRIRKSIWL